MGAEPSARSDLFEANARALEAALGHEGAKALMDEPPSLRMEIVSTLSGTPTARYEGAYVYSKVDPAGEAMRLVEQQASQDSGAAIFFNFGLGYHVEAYLKRHPSHLAIVVEPDLASFVTALGARDVSSVLASDGFRLVLSGDPDILPALLDTCGVQRPVIYRIRPLAAKDADYFRRLETVLSSWATRRDINRNTLARFGRLWVRNLIRNLSIVARAPGIERLRGSFLGMPAVVLAAGPSLDLVLPFLEEMAKRAIVIAVDTSLRAVLAAGVRPDFVVVVDPQYWNARHLDGCALTAAAKGPGSPILISESSTNPLVFHRHEGQVFLCSSLFPLGSYLEQTLGTKGKLGAGGSVATSTWDFARLIGCNPIYVAGLDLGYPDGKTHFRGAFFEERAFTVASRDRPVEELCFHALHGAAPFLHDNAEGGRTLTDHRLEVYRWWFENQMKIYPDANTYSLAPKGVRIEGMRLSDPEAVLSRSIIRGEIDEVLSGIAAGTSESDSSGSGLVLARLETLRSELAELETTAQRGLRLAAELKRAVEAQAPVDGILGELARVDGSIQRIASREITGFLAHDVATEILESRPAGEAQAVEDTRRLYERVAEAAAYHLSLIIPVIARQSLS